MDTPRKGQLIQITKRVCSDKVQPLVKVMNTYRVLGAEHTKDNTLVVIVKSHQDPAKTTRINAKRFTWRVLSDGEQRELIKKAQEHEEAVKKAASFSEHEIAMLLYHPMILEMLMWDFAENARKEAALCKLPQFKQVSRTLKAIHDEDERNIHNALYKYHSNLYKRIKAEFESFKGRIQSDIVKLYYSTNNVVKKYCGQYPYDSIRTNALMALMMISVLVEHYEATQKMIQSKDYELTSLSPIMRFKVIIKILEAYIADNDAIDRDDEILINNIKVFYNRIIAEPLPWESLNK